MSTQSATFYWAACDGNGCDRKTTQDDHTVYENTDQLDAQFIETTRYEGDTLLESHGWIQVGDKHYCPDHTYFDDDTETRLPLPAGRVDLSGKDAA